MDEGYYVGIDQALDSTYVTLYFVSKEPPKDKVIQGEVISDQKELEQ